MPGTAEFANKIHLPFPADPAHWVAILNLKVQWQNRSWNNAIGCFYCVDLIGTQPQLDSRRHGMVTEMEN